MSETEQLSLKNTSESEERLIRQYTEIARLAGSLAHEIKNPLSTIRLNMELLAEDLDELNDSPARSRAIKKVEIVRKECGRLEDLMNEFLNFTRAHHLQLTSADINQELSEILKFFRPQANAAKVELIEFLASGLPAVQLDKKSFSRVMLNLLLNALQAMPDGGQLVVRTRLSDSKKQIIVDLIDNGCGIAQELIEKIFEPFFSTKRGGSGLGLPTVRKVIEGHGGEILLKSEPKQGTQITLLLPVLPSQSF